MSKKAGRSIRKFHTRLEHAVVDRQQMLDKEQLSLESGLGKLVIVVSRQGNFASSVSRSEQINAFEEEAEMLRDSRQGHHQDIIVRHQSVVGDLVLDLQDPEVTDLVLIGNGSIADFWAAGGKHFDWLTVAKKAKHLKQGKIEQRVCGHFPLKTSVPLGTFALRDQTQLIAPTGQLIPDVHPAGELFSPVYTKPNNDSADILALIDEHHNPSAGIFRGSTSVLRPASV